jgi:hypothetical protein
VGAHLVELVVERRVDGAAVVAPLLPGLVDPRLVGVEGVLVVGLDLLPLAVELRETGEGVVVVMAQRTKHLDGRLQLVAVAVHQVVEAGHLRGDGRSCRPPQSVGRCA